MVSSSSLVGLQLLVRRLQLAVGLLELVLQAAVVGDVVERRGRADDLVRAVHQRAHLDLQADGLAAPVQRHVGDPDRAPFGLRLLDVAAQLERTVGDLEIVEGAPDVVRGHPEQLLGLPVGQGQHTVRGDHDLGHRSGQQCLVAQHVQPGRIGHGPGRPQLAQQGCGLRELVRRLAEHPALQVDGREQRAVAEQHLRLPQEQNPRRGEREVEAGEDAGLGLGVEVHQGVAAHEQVDPRDRGVLHEVVAPEDHRPAQVLAEDVPAARVVEVPLEQLGRDAAHLALGVAGLPGVGERLLVDVGCVDLDAVAELGEAHQLGQHDREGVGLFTGRAARAPHAQRLAHRLPRQQCRQYLQAEVLPGLGVAEEAGDVDQDRVEQRRELVALQLEAVEVVDVARDPDLGHPPVDAPHQAGALVTGEVESPAGLHVLQQRLERRVRLVHPPLRAAPIAHRGTAA